MKQFTLLLFLLISSTIFSQLCEPPANLSATDITVTTAQISWEDFNIDPQAFLLNWSDASGAISGGDFAFGSPYNLTGLIANTTYTITIQADCTVDLFSDPLFSDLSPLTFTTAAAPCVPSTIDSVTVQEDCGNSQFSLAISISNVGTGTFISDGTNNYPIVAGTVTAGPYAMDSNVTLSGITVGNECDFAIGTYTDNCPVPEPTTAIPDTNFEQALIDLYIDTDGLNGSVLTSSISGVTNLYVPSKSIADLTGIEDFTALESLTCFSNQITSLDVSANSALTNLSCGSNQLTSLNIQNTSLSSFHAVSNTALTCIQVDDVAYSNTAENWAKDATAYYSVDCSVTPPTTSIPDANFEQALIDLGIDSGAIDGSVITAFISGVTVLDVSNLEIGITDLTGIEDFIALTTLYCSGNSLTSLDVSANSALETLSCGGNLITSLDLSTNTALTSLSCGDNQLTSLDVNANTALLYLEFYTNQLTSLDVSTNIDLISLRCNSNLLTSLDVSANAALTTLICSSNLLTSLNMQNGANDSLTSFQAFSIPDLTCILVDNVANANSAANWYKPSTASYSIDCTATTAIPDANFEQALIDLGIDSAIDGIDGSVLTASISGVSTLDVDYKNITNLTGLEDFTNLQFLYCNNNQLASIDVSTNTALRAFQFRNNQLASIDVSTNTALYVLYCDNNQLTSLDVSTNSALQYLSFSNNQITSLDVSTNSALESLNCANNQLTGLDVSANMALTSLYAVNNNQLTCIQVDNVAYSEAATDWTKDATASYSLDCSVTPLANDDCSGAEALTLGTEVSVVLEGATYSGVSSTCDAATTIDLWYSFVAPTSGNVTITWITGNVSLFADCTATTAINCNTPAITGLTAATTYYVKLSESAQEEARLPAMGNTLKVEDSATLSNTDFSVTSINMYPNPASQFISVTGLKNKADYIIYTVLGKMINKGTVSNNEQIDVQNLSNGLYFLKLDNSKTIKFIKE